MSSLEYRSRRSVLRAVGGATVVGLAGCLRGREAVSVLAAGSLAVTVEDVVGPGFREAVGVEVHGEYFGTNALVRMIREGTKHPDVAVSADVQLLRDRLAPEYVSWDAVFAANEVGLAYDPETELGRRLAAGEAWHEVLGDAQPGEVAISDPDLDPLGYRAIHLFELAEEQYDMPGFRHRLERIAYVEPEEPQLLAGVVAGNRAIAVSYRNMALDHGLSFHELPAELNFSDPAFADTYASVAYTTDDGYTVRGTPTRYSATVLDGADDHARGREFVQFLLDAPDLLREAGLAVPSALPRTWGDAPVSTP